LREKNVRFDELELMK